MSCSVHDLAEYEAFGVPAVLVASEQFQSATRAQASALGTSPEAVYVAHPIQDRTDAEIDAMAEAVVDQLLAAVVTAP